MAIKAGNKVCSVFTTGASLWGMLFQDKRSSSSGREKIRQVNDWKITKKPVITPPLYLHRWELSRISSNARVCLQGILVCLTWKVVTGPATFLIPRSGRAPGLIITIWQAHQLTWRIDRTATTINTSLETMYRVQLRHYSLPTFTVELCPGLDLWATVYEGRLKRCLD